MLFALYDESAKQAESFMVETKIETINRGISSGMNSIGQIVFFIIVFVVILALSYYSTKYLGKYRIQAMTGKNIRVIETMSLGIGSALYLIKTGNQYFLISVSKENVSLISKIDAESITEIEQGEVLPFEKIMKDCLSKFGQSKK